MESNYRGNYTEGTEKKSVRVMECSNNRTSNYRIVCSYKFGLIKIVMCYKIIAILVNITETAANIWIDDFQHVFDHLIGFSFQFHLFSVLLLEIAIKHLFEYR